MFLGTYQIILNFSIIFKSTKKLQSTSVDLQWSSISHYQNSVVRMSRALLRGIDVCMLVFENIVRNKRNVNRENHIAT